MSNPIPAPVMAVIDALSRDTAEGLTAYLMLDVSLREEVRKIAGLAPLDWLEQMGAPGRGHPFAAVEAALALQRAETHAACAQWGPAKQLIDAHAHLLASVPRAQEISAEIARRLS